MVNEVIIDGTVFVPKDTQPEKPKGKYDKLYNLIPASVLIAGICYILYYTGYLGGYIEQSIDIYSDGVNLTTVCRYQNKHIFLEFDPIKTVTPELKIKRLEQAEKILQTIKN